MLGIGNNIASASIIEQEYSVAFDGTGDYILLEDAVARTTGSVSIWFKSSTTGTRFGLIGFGKDGSTTDFGWIAFGGSLTGSYDNESLAFAVKTNNTNRIGAFVREGENAYNDGAWHNVVLTVSASSNAIYVDGDAKTPTYNVGSSSTGSYFLSTATGSGTQDIIGIGRRFYSGSPLNINGNVDEVAIWSSILDADNVTTIYNSGKPFNLTNDRGNYDQSSNLVNYYRMNEGSKATIYDKGSGGNDGTLQADSAFSRDTP